MSISYSGVIGFKAKATLPSVDTWNYNMNILRDPPKSITTLKNDKVGQTPEITQMIQDSGDRIGESISMYARGVNPMVSVDYSNNGNNGGQRRGNRASAGLADGTSNSGRQSYLPYRILDKGAFRPPIRDQRDLFPLSRLPRVWTSSFTQPGFADFSKKAMVPLRPEDTKGIKQEAQMTRACIRPTATYQIETPVMETYDVKNVIKNPITISASSGIHSQKKINGEMSKPYAQVLDNTLKADVNVNRGRSNNQSNTQLSHMNTEKYTHDALQGSMGTNKSQNIQRTPINELYNVNTEGMIKENFNLSYTTPHKGYEKQEYMHEAPELERTLPVYETHTNKGMPIHKRFDQVSERELYNNRPSVALMNHEVRGMIQRNDEFDNRSYNLKPTIQNSLNQDGGFDPRPRMPQVYKENQLIDFDQRKNSFRRSVYEMQHERNMEIGNTPYLT